MRIFQDWKKYPFWFDFFIVVGTILPTKAPNNLTLSRINFYEHTDTSNLNIFVNIYIVKRMYDASLFCRKTWNLVYILYSYTGLEKSHASVSASGKQEWYLPPEANWEGGFVCEQQLHIRKNLMLFVLCRIFSRRK